MNVVIHRELNTSNGTHLPETSMCVFNLHAHMGNL